MRTILAVLVLASAVAVGADGRVYVQSDPPGAEISLLVDGAGKDLGKTPSMVTVPQGDQVIILTMKGYELNRVDIKVGDGIAKTGVVTLQVETKQVDVIFEEDWAIAVDGKRLRDVDGRPAKTPCTITVPPTTKEIVLSKDGYEDITYSITGLASPISVKATPKKKIAKPKDATRTVKFDALYPMFLKTPLPVVELCSDGKVYSNRTYWVSDLPEALVGQACIQTSIKTGESIAFTILRPTTIYVAYGQKPATNFEDTGGTLTVYESKEKPFQLKVYKRDVQPGQVKLPALANQSETHAVVLVKIK